MGIVFMAHLTVSARGRCTLGAPTADLKLGHGLFAVSAPTLLGRRAAPQESTSPSDFLRGLAKGVANPDRHLPARPAPRCERQHAVWLSAPAHCFPLPLPSARRAGH